MKPTTIPIPKKSRALRTILKHVVQREKQYDTAAKNLRRLRIVHSMRAGHVRGGHAFH